MSITIHTEPLAYTEFRDFIISSANWFVPSLLQMPNLDEWILKMYHNGSMYYTISESNIISLIVGYYNREERFLYIPYVCVNPNHQGHGISQKTINYIIEHLSKLEKTITMHFMHIIKWDFMRLRIGMKSI